jgi:tetratricopeptide (TPR) repeat protein
MHDFENSDDLHDLIHKFEAVIQDNKVQFFDVDEFEFIAEHYLHEGHDQLALKAIEMASKVHPGESSFPLMQARYFLDQQDFKKAKLTISRAEILDPDNADLKVIKGEYFALIGQYKKAILWFEAALKTPDQLADYYTVIHLLSNAYIALERPMEALPYLHELLEIDPEDEMVMFMLKNVYDALGDLDGQLVYFSDFVNKNPYSEIGWYNLGLAQTETNDLDGALRSFDFALLIDDYFIAAYFEKGRIQELMGDYAKAIDTYMSGFEYFDPNGFSYLRIAACYRQLKNYQKAKIYYRKALKLDPDLDEAHLEMAVLSLDEENLFEAVHHIKIAVGMNIDNPDYHIIAANIFRQGGLYLEAEVHYKKAMSLGFKEADIYFDYAELLFDIEEWDAGIQLLEQGLLENPDAADLMVLLSGMLIGMELRKEGIELAEKAAAIDNEAKDLLFECYPDLANDLEVVHKLSKY